MRPLDDKRIRRQVHLTETDDRLAREVAERTDGGNISRMFRRLVRDEAARIDIATPSDKKAPVAA